MYPPMASRTQWDLFTPQAGRLHLCLKTWQRGCVCPRPLQGGPSLGASVHPKVAACTGVPVPSPARLCVAVCWCLWPPACRQTASDPRRAMSVSLSSPAREHWPGSQAGSPGETFSRAYNNVAFDLISFPPFAGDCVVWGVLLLVIIQ